MCSPTTLSASHTPPPISKSLLETQRRARTCPLRVCTRTNSGALVVHSTTIRALVSSGLVPLVHIHSLLLSILQLSSAFTALTYVLLSPYHVFFFSTVVSGRGARVKQKRQSISPRVARRGRTSSWSIGQSPAQPQAAHRRQGRWQGSGEIARTHAHSFFVRALGVSWCC